MANIELLEQMIQPVLTIRVKTTMDLLPKLIGESFMQITSYLNELGEGPIGAPYAAYYNMDIQNVEVEVGFPVAGLFPDRDKIRAGLIPPGKVASYMYKGPYSEMESAYQEIINWIADHGYERSDVYYEYYYNSPGEVEESELLTRIVIPLKRNKVKQQQND
ncbi:MULTISPECIES: GyrI-like domain-containing protein [Bacillaceae]|uniref:GyrI-like domain-containing protein n=1 Tax=Bacillaceae TaxID=186817 RepID=UPI002FFFA147